jgi:hypothetical protein
MMFINCWVCRCYVDASDFLCILFVCSLLNKLIKKDDFICRGRTSSSISKKTYNVSTWVPTLGHIST